MVADGLDPDILHSLTTSIVQVFQRLPLVKHEWVFPKNKKTKFDPTQDTTGSPVNEPRSSVNRRQSPSTGHAE